MINRPCENCGVDMEVQPSHNVQGHFKRFCSRLCLIKKIEVACRVCEKIVKRTQLQVEQRDSIFCSNECKGVGKRNGRERLCVVCEEVMYITPANERLVCCSRECQAKSKVTGHDKECEICDEVFWAFKSAEERSGARFCSQKCSAVSLRSKDFAPLSRSNEGKKWAKEVKKRDDYTCKKCKSKEELHAHHILNWKDYPELRFDLVNGMTLCKQCHINLHKEQL